MEAFLLGVFVPFGLEELDELLLIVLLDQYLAITCGTTATERLLELAGEVCEIAVGAYEASDDERFLARTSGS